MVDEDGKGERKKRMLVVMMLLIVLLWMWKKMIFVEWMIEGWRVDVDEDEWW